MNKNRQIYAKWGECEEKKKKKKKMNKNISYIRAINQIMWGDFLDFYPVSDMHVI